jgi:DNA polymerase III psi subunit
LLVHPKILINGWELSSLLVVQGEIAQEIEDEIQLTLSNAGFFKTWLTQSDTT